MFTLAGKKEFVAGIANEHSVAAGCARSFCEAGAELAVTYLIDEARERAPQRRLVTIEDVGAMAAGLVSDAAKNVTGNISYVDAGYHVMS